MSNENKPESLLSDSSPFALLVNAANAQSREAMSAAQVASSSEALRAYEAAAKDQQGKDRIELKEALQREALERELLERHALQQRAALFGMAGQQGVSSQEIEYLQQLRLEALVQQRRQETLAQLALAQEMGMSQDLQGLVNAQQLRQAALLRQEMLLGNGGGIAAALAAEGGYPQGLDQLSAQLGNSSEERMLIKQYLEEQARQQRMLGMGLSPAGASSPQMMSHSGRGTPNMANRQAESAGVAKGKEMASGSMKGSPKVESKAPEAGTTVLPCRARGMPIDHTAKTAYFVVREDIKHGTELVCSYYACRNSGIKFRYCAVCKLPVAKRNFFIRHKHAGKIPSDKLPQGGMASDVAAAEVDSESPENPLVPDGEKVSSTDILAKLLEKGAKEVSSPAVKSSPKPSPKSSPPPRKDKQFEARSQRWESLLSKRPRSADKLEDWVREVLAVSDLDTPVATCQPVAPSPVKLPAKAQASSKKKSEIPTATVKKSSAVRMERASEKKDEKKVEKAPSPPRDPSVVLSTADAKEGVEKETSKTGSGPEKLETPSTETVPPTDDSSMTEAGETKDEGATASKGDVDMKEEDGQESDAGSSSSDGSVDLRETKKARTN
eukprot:Nitzschia sp. Nitz4//scaffold41_size133979//85831//87850//NITZ4_003358-RA/size133979-snap-gene-0.105-mRNA-1//1//CDS//3329551503//4471//frame0